MKGYVPEKVLHHMQSLLLEGFQLAAWMYEMSNMLFFGELPMRP